MVETLRSCGGGSASFLRDARTGVGLGTLSRDAANALERDGSEPPVWAGTASADAADGGALVEGFAGSACRVLLRAARLLDVERRSAARQLIFPTRVPKKDVSKKGDHDRTLRFARPGLLQVCHVDVTTLRKDSHNFKP